MPVPAKVDLSRDQQALEMRRAGKDYSEIAKALGLYDASHARRVVMKLIQTDIKKLAETADEVRNLELQRLDKMFEVAYAKALDGHLLSIDRALRLMERRASLLGLDAPKRQEISGPDGSPIEIDERITLTQEERDSRILTIIEAARARATHPNGEGVHQPALPTGVDMASSDGATNGRMAE